MFERLFGSMQLSGSSTAASGTQTRLTSAAVIESFQDSTTQTTHLPHTSIGINVGHHHHYADFECVRLCNKTN